MTRSTVQPPPRPVAPKKASPAMPVIPGVNDKPAASQARWKPLLIVFVAALLCASGFAFWLSHRHSGNLEASAPAEAPDPSIPNPSADPKPAADPNAIATLDELARPWSSKAFKFADPQSHEDVAAMVIHLPGSGQSFWAFSLNTPFSRCPLQYVSDLSALSERFAFPATHPMVVSDCDGTIYDPLKMATLSDGSWARGDIVRGSGIRPPLAIQVEVRGRQLVAGRME